MLAKIRKAVTGGIGAGVAAYAAGAADGAVSVQDWITVVGSIIVIGFATYWVPNAGPTPPAGVTGTKVNELK